MEFPWPCWSEAASHSSERKGVIPSGCPIVELIADPFYSMREGGAAEMSQGPPADVGLIVDPDIQIRFN